MDKEEILKTLDKYELDKEQCIILSGASLVVQGVIDSTSDIDIATTTEFYNSLNWEKKVGALGKEIKYIDNIEISNNLYRPNQIVEVNGYKFADLSFILEVKEMLYRLKDKQVIKKLRKTLYNKSLFKFIGTGDMQNANLKNTSAYIKFDKTMLLVDCGMTVFHELLNKELLSNLDKIYIAITHTHPDHVGSLAALLLYLKFYTNTKINIIINSLFKEQKLHIENTLKTQGVLPDFYNFIDLPDVDSFFKIKSEKIKHCPELDSYAYEIIIDEDTSYYYLGDNNDINFFKKTLKRLKPNDYIFTDISISNSNVHLNLLELEKIVQINNRHQIYCMHFANEQTIKKAKSLHFSIATID